jgi:protein gp37
MSDQTKIEWADATWNPWEGCTKVSPGCAKCYAEARNHRFGNDNWGKGKPRRRTSAANWRKPVKWNAQVERQIAERCKDGESAIDDDPIQRPRIFPSLCDWMDGEVPVSWLADFVKLMYRTPNLDWLLLTKRPERIRPMLEAVLDEEQYQVWFREMSPPCNIWMGTSVEDQERADERIPELLKIPAKVRFLSVEPLLEDVNLEDHLVNTVSNSIDWVIVGAESGPGARPCNVEWIHSVVRQCKGAHCPVFVKQLGARPITDNANLYEWPEGVKLLAHGQSAAGARIGLKHRKGGDMQEWPKELRVRDFPAAC